MILFLFVHEHACITYMYTLCRCCYYYFDMTCSISYDVSLCMSSQACCSVGIVCSALYVCVVCYVTLCRYCQSAQCTVCITYVSLRHMPCPCLNYMYLCNSESLVGKKSGKFCFVPWMDMGWDYRM